MPSFTSESYTTDGLLASGPHKTDTATIISGETVVRGHLLGKITASGKLNISLSGASDGSETPYAIAVEDVDASAGDVTNAGIYVFGSFNSDEITFGTAHTAASVKDGLRDRGIFLVDGDPV